MVGCVRARETHLMRDGGVHGKAAWRQRLNRSDGIKTANYVYTTIKLIYMYVEFTVARPIGTL